MGDKLILNFAAKFQRQFIILISHVKFQNCHDNISRTSNSAKMASSFKTTTVHSEEEAAENLNTRKRTIHFVRVFQKWCDEK